MTRPDSRLLAKASTLPVVPVGATVWRGDDAFVVLGGPWPDGSLSLASARWRGESHGLHGSIPAGPSITPQSRVPAGDVFVDLSVPAQHDGLDVRLDALGAALKALHPDAYGIDRCGSTAYQVCDDHGRTIQIVTVPPYLEFCDTVLLSAWPDLTGLSLDDAVRAVVVAALHARSTS